MKCLLREPGKIVFLLELMAKDAALSANQHQVALKFIDKLSSCFSRSKGRGLNCKINDGHSQHRHERCSYGRMFVLAFWQQITCADIKQEPTKQSQDPV